MNPIQWCQQARWQAIVDGLTDIAQTFGIPDPRAIDARAGHVFSASDFRIRSAGDSLVAEVITPGGPTTIFSLYGGELAEDVPGTWEISVGVLAARCRLYRAAWRAAVGDRSLAARLAARARPPQEYLA